MCTGFYRASVRCTYDIDVTVMYVYVRIVRSMVIKFGQLTHVGEGHLY